ncbi:MAG TPA: class I SAM-dependent methyltransferase [Actinomycetota bacterium]|jgi:SAM-dependent methyltransferase
MSDRDAPRRRNHPWFARIYDPVLARPAEKWEGKYRDELCAEAEGVVLEVGAGTGMNFSHYATATRVVAIEPEPNMRGRAARRVEAASVPIRLLGASAERLPFPDETFDTVVCSLVLCTVGDQSAGIAECRRVLKSNGSMRFFEHVRSMGLREARWQDRLERPWGFFGGGCHPNRDTLGAFVEHGFTVRFRRFAPPIPGGWFLPHVIGVARAGSQAERGGGAASP